MGSHQPVRLASFCSDGVAAALGGGPGHCRRLDTQDTVESVEDGHWVVGPAETREKRRREIRQPEELQEGLHLPVGTVPEIRTICRYCNCVLPRARYKWGRYLTVLGSAGRLRKYRYSVLCTSIRGSRFSDSQQHLC